MKKYKILNKIFGKNDEEYNLLNTWAMEKRNDTQNLIDLANFWESVDNISTYQEFDADKGLHNTITQIRKYERRIKLYKVLFLIAFVSLLGFIGTFYFFQKEDKAVITYFAQNMEQINRNDGTKITLYADTKLIENIKTNTYTLHGEATFDVTKQESPLIIKLDNGEVEVVGTKFMVNNRDGVSTLDLFEGQVELRNTSNQQVSLNAGERGEIFPSKILVTPFKRKDAKISLVYSNISLQSVLEEINALFDSQYEILPSMSDVMITATFKNQKLSSIVSELQLISGIRIAKVKD